MSGSSLGKLANNFRTVWKKMVHGQIFVFTLAACILDFVAETCLTWHTGGKTIITKGFVQMAFCKSETHKDCVQHLCAWIRTGSRSSAQPTGAVIQEPACSQLKSRTILNKKSYSKVAHLLCMLLLSYVFISYSRINVPGDSSHFLSH